jgi:methyl-accepting chemotaxis protein
MDATAMTLQPPGQDLRVRRLWEAMHDFFRYHGVFAPGVRLLRKLSFRAKVWTLAVAFLTPAMLLGAIHFREATARVDAAELELKGLQYSQAVARVADAVLVAGRQRVYLAIGVDASSIPAEPTDLSALMRALDDVHVRLGEDLRMAHLHERIHAAYAALPAPTAAMPLGELTPRYRKMLDELRAAALHLSAVAAIGRGTDPVTAQLLQAVLVVLPDLHDSVAVVTARGGQVLAGERSMAARGRVFSAHALASARLTEVEALLRSVESAQPGMLAKPQAVTVVDEVRSFLDGVRLSMLGEAVSGSGQMHLAEGAQASRALMELHEALLDVSERRLVSAAARARNAAHLMLGGAGLCLLLALYVLSSINAVMCGGLLLLKEQVTRIAGGDLSARPIPRGDDEIADALSSLGDSLGKLSDLFANVRHDVGGVAKAANDIARENLDLSQRSQRDEATMKAVTSGVADYVDKLEASGRRVDDAMAAVQELRQQAARSRTQMHKLRERMDTLQHNSRRIGEIVDLIDGIAFRTNILALNASVEAAKAGEAGRGFAVVAQEVRSLAQRSAESARGIAELITQSIDDIGFGHALTAESAAAVEASDEQAGHIHAAVSEVVRLTGEGLKGSQRIVSEIRRLADMAVENRSLAEQVSVASSAMSQRGKALAGNVAAFRLA